MPQLVNVAPPVADNHTAARSSEHLQERKNNACSPTRPWYSTHPRRLYSPGLSSRVRWSERADSQPTDPGRTAAALLAFLNPVDGVAPPVPPAAQVVPVALL